MRVRLLSLVLTILCLLCSGSFGFSADLIIRDVTRSTGTAMRHIVLEGEIASGDSEKLAAAMEGHLVSTVVLNSPGGDVLEAMKISSILNERLIAAEAPYDFRNFPSKRVSCWLSGFEYDLADARNCVCYSACAIVWLTAPSRLGDYIGVHRPRFDYKYFSGLSAQEAKKKYAEMQSVLEQFLYQHDVPPGIVSRMMSTPSSENYILSNDEIGSIERMRPFLEELLHARCSSFHQEFLQIQALQLEYENLKSDYNSRLQNEGETPEIADLGERADQAESQWHEFERSSEYRKCRNHELRKLVEERQLSK